MIRRLKACSSLCGRGQSLDFALDELAFICGITNRYMAFVGMERQDVLNLYAQVQVRCLPCSTPPAPSVGRGLSLT
jgi:hypothetical protein